MTSLEKSGNGAGGGQRAAETESETGLEPDLGLHHGTD